MSTQVLHRGKILANKYGFLNIILCMAKIGQVLSVTQKDKIYQKAIVW